MRAPPTLLLGALAAILASCGGDDDGLPLLDAATSADAPQADAPPPLDARADDAAAGDGGAGLPDLGLVAAQMTDSWFVGDLTFEEGDCALVEGCIDAIGTRHLLRFDTITGNSGSADLVVGAPGPDNELFEYSSCHGHYHFQDYASYELVDASGLVKAGHKQAFCLMDSQAIDPDQPSNHYNCAYQGISSGWADTYSSSLVCQWIDVTDIASGNYTLRITVNSAGILAESDYSNNTLEIPVAF